MAKNRISQYFTNAQSQTVLPIVPEGFIMIPVGTVPQSALSMTQQLHQQALAAALQEAERKFQAIMNSLVN
ncbi:hypothetical protein SH661x_001998 [Planctomicrobium sp. SH661]|uniref:hypothetical protein n=1 Tax=Planctomicrobium sp. SH661 TaxID=3448124 RepID=UPI003F5B5531